MQIESEIKQKKFLNEFIKLDVNIMFTASYLGHFKSCILKPHEISWQQFNILRILRGQHPEPASIKSLSERMVDRNTNTSRLVDKLVKKELVHRETNEADRRLVDISITTLGLKKLVKCSVELEEALTKKLGNLSLSQAEAMNHWLDKIRD